MTLRLSWLTTLLVSLWLIYHAPASAATTTTTPTVNKAATTNPGNNATTTTRTVTNTQDTNGKTTMSKSTTSLFPDTTTTEDKHGNDTENGYSHHGNGITLVPFHLEHVKNPLIMTLVVIIAGMSKMAFHFSHSLSTKVPESCVLIVLGVVIGIIFHFSGLSNSIQLYEPHEFFLYLLPPIILEAAFSLHDRTFAENLGSVLLFAVVGTVLNCFIIGLGLYGLYQAGAMEEINCSLVQVFVFSALIVAVDPVAVLAVFQEVGVNSTLYYLVFGESLLNDGVTVVLYNVMQILNTTEITVFQIFLGIAKFFVVVICGLLIGVTCGLLSSFITKFTNSVKVVEPLIVFGFAYLSYIMSELFEFSGIISIIACGILQVHYAFHNVTNKSRLAIKFLAKVMASANEIIIFMFLGLATVNDNHDWKTGFTLWTTLLCILTRFLVTFSLSAVIDKYTSGVRKIKFDEMFMISYGGLRGAVCFSLVALINEKEIPMKNMFVTTTLFVIFFTVFVQGGSIKWLVKKLRVARADVKEDMQLNEELASHVFDHIMAGVEEIVGYTHGTHHIKMKLDHIDDKVFRPLLMRNATSTDLGEISHYYERLVMKEHYKNLHLGGATLPHVETSIRHLDSEMALDRLYRDQDEDEHGADDSQHDQRPIGRTRSFGGSLHTFFSNTLHSVRSQLHLQVDNRNLGNDKKHNLLSHLRKKHHRNKKLSELRNKTETVRLPGTSVDIAALNNELKVDSGGLERKTSQVRFEIAGEDDGSESSNGYAEGKVSFHL